MGLPNWFGHVRDTFVEQLSPLYGAKDFTALQVGAYAGHASEWLLAFLLTDEGSRLDDVDTWLGSDEAEHHALDFTEIEREYRERLKHWLALGQVSAFKMTSDDFFRMSCPVEEYDFIYIDGDHRSHQVLRDAINADAGLKHGGILAFDDYSWSAGTGVDADNPKLAIDAFLATFGRYYEVLHEGQQVWLRKH